MSRESVSALTIGNFDGVHLGHAELVRRASAYAPGARVVALVFDPHPLAVLKPEAAPERLSTFEQRRRWLLGLGADDVVRIEPTPELLAMPAQAFVDLLVREHRPLAIVEGADFRFGKGRTGSVELLSELGGRAGFRVDVVEQVVATLTDQSVVPVSSSLVRWLVARGRVTDAAALLGRDYELAGVVVRGDQRGRTIGCPTANIATTQALPIDGVYAGVGELPDGRVFPAAISVGDKPTFDGVERACEAHLIGWGGPLSEGSGEYGWQLLLRFGAWLRDQARFEGVGPLLEQITRDVRRTERWFEQHARSGRLAQEAHA